MATKKRSLSGSPKFNTTDVITYISLLRGVNVGGGNVIKKDKLQLAFENVGCMRVRTYIQSGNIVFEASTEIPRNDLLLSIKNSLKRYLPKDIDILLFTEEEWRIVVDSSPYARKDINSVSDSSSSGTSAVPGKGKAGVVNIKTEYVTFLCTGVHNLCHNGSLNVDKVAAKGADACAQLSAMVSELKIEGELDFCIVKGNIISVPVVYTYTPKGITEGKYTAKMFHEKHSSVNATTRNYDTILKLLEMAMDKAK